MNSIKTLIVVSMISLMFSEGCALMSTSTYERWVTMKNGSDVELYAGIAFDGYTNDFGIIGHKGASKDALARMICSDAFTIKWKEGSIYNPENTTTVDLKKYSSKMAHIRNFTFSYLGNGRWQVKAYSGVSDKSPEVKPD